MATPLTFNWSEYSDEISGEILDGATTTSLLDTGGINVGVTYFDDDGGTISAVIDTTTNQFVDDGETFASDSALRLVGSGGDNDAVTNTSTARIDFSAVSGSGFSDEVENVSFRINDFDTSDWIDVITVRAFDADGNPVTVNLTLDGDTFSGTDTTLTANEPSGPASAEAASILVEIEGPVAYFEIDYDNGDDGGQRVWVTDVHFDAIDSSLDGTVEGTSGNDTIDVLYVDDPDGDMVDNNDAILAGDTGDDDLIFGFEGDDTISAGAGDDEVFGGDGSDEVIVDAGEGTDTITGGEDASGLDADVLTFTDDNGTEGVDVTLTGDEAGTYDFPTDGGDGSFTEIEEFNLTDQDDTFDGSLSTDGTSVDAGAGDDSLIGGAGDDSFDGGDGDDTLSGGLGADTITAGAGEDVITVSEGDSVAGGDGDDLFVVEDLAETGAANITIDGGDGDETDGDTLQLAPGILSPELRDTFVDDGTGSFSGTIELDDGSIITFTDIENIICFTPTTRIATPNGLVAIENLKVGDLVVTRDHGLQPIRWLESRVVPAVDRFAPVRIRKNVLCGQDNDLIVSPQHRVLFQGYRAELLFGESEVLVSAKHLVDGIDVTQDEQSAVTYIHMMFDRHEIIFAEGAATESFHPGDIGMNAVSDEAREELFAVFPELRSDPMLYGNTARRCLKSHEAKLIRS